MFVRGVLKSFVVRKKLLFEELTTLNVLVNVQKKIETVCINIRSSITTRSVLMKSRPRDMSYFSKSILKARNI